MNFIIFKASMEKQAHRLLKCLIRRKNSKNYGETLKAALQRMGRYIIDYQYFLDKAENFSIGIFRSRERNLEWIIYIP